MSLFSTQSSWPGMCSGANQSPINVSQSIAKPCKLSCDLKIDDINATQGSVMISDEGLVVSGRLGSCKFRDATYSCSALLINHPSNHTVESVQADGEVTAIFYAPTGESLHVSSLFKVSSSPGPSIDFFKQVIPFAQKSASNIMLNGWSLQHMVPADGSYYTYEGSAVVPPCSPAEVVVFKTMINMDQTDFAFLVKNVQAGSRSIQALGSRDLFYNDSADTGFLPHDNKTYLVMRPLGKQKKKTKIDKADLKTQAAKDNAAQPGLVSSVAKSAYNNWDDFLEWLYYIFFSIAIVGGLYYLAPKISGLNSIYDWISRRPQIEQMPNPLN